MSADKVYLNINPKFDWRRSIFQLVYIKYDERYREYIEGAITKNMTYLEYLNHTDVMTQKGALLKFSATNDKAQNRMIDLIVLVLSAFSLISLLLNLMTLLSRIYKGYADEISSILAVISIANIVHVVSIILYMVFINYDNQLVNWIATMSVCYANWCYLPLLACAFIQVYSTASYQRLVTLWRVRLVMILLLVLASLTPIPGYTELVLISSDECSKQATEVRSDCVQAYRSTAQLQMSIVPLFIFLLPFIFIASLLLLSLNCHKTNNEKKGEESCNGFGNTAIQALLTGIWFIVLYFPTVMLYGILGANDEVVAPLTRAETRKSFDMDLERLMGVTGMIRTALICRLLNLSLNFYINLLCGRDFRQTFTSVICCRELSHEQPRVIDRSRRVSQQRMLDSRESSSYHTNTRTV